MMTTTFRQRQIIRSRTLYRKFQLTQHDKFCSHEVEATKSFYMGTQCVQPSYAMVGHGENEKLAMLRSVSLSRRFLSSSGRGRQTILDIFFIAIRDKKRRSGQTRSPLECPTWAVADICTDRTDRNGPPPPPPEDGESHKTGIRWAWHTQSVAR